MPSVTDRMPRMNQMWFTDKKTFIHFDDDFDRDMKEAGGTRVTVSHGDGIYHSGHVLVNFAPWEKLGHWIVNLISRAKFAKLDGGMSQNDPIFPTKALVDHLSDITPDTFDEDRMMQTLRSLSAHSYKFTQKTCSLHPVKFNELKKHYRVQGYIVDRPELGRGRVELSSQCKAKMKFVLSNRS